MTFTPASYNDGVQGELEREPGMTVAAWQQRPESARARRNRYMCVRIRASHNGRRRYGQPQIWKDLREEGERVSEKRVARLMRAEGLRARARKRFRSTTMDEHDQPSGQRAGPSVRCRAS